MQAQSNTLRNVVIGILVIAALAAGYWYIQRAGNPLPLASGDTVTSWNFQGSHNDGGPNEQKARDEIARLEAGLKDDAVEPTDYALDVSIANQYVLLGDGRAAYNYLGKALAIDSEKTGLAWHNMATLMERLGAYNTARIAFDRAVIAQPNIDMYHVARLEFLVNRFPLDGEAIDKAFAESKEQLKTPAITFQPYERWLVGKRRYADAIALLRSVRDAIPEDQRASIDVEIQKLVSQQ